MEIPTIPLENLLNKAKKILLGEKPSLISIGLNTELQPGKLLQGKIIKILPMKKAMVLIGGQKMVAELPEGNLKLQDNLYNVEPKHTFKPGKKIYAQVEKLNPSPVLKLISIPKQKIEDKGYTANFSGKIIPKIIKPQELKAHSENTIPVKVDRNENINSLLVTTKPKFNFNFGKRIHKNNEKLDPSLVLKLTSPQEQKIQKKGDITNLSQQTKTEFSNFINFKRLKLSSNNIIPVRVIGINGENALSVEFEGQEFIVKNKNAHLYRLGVTVRVQFQKFEDGFRPILLDSPQKLGNTQERVNISNQHIPDGFRSTLDSHSKSPNIDPTIKFQSYTVEKGFKYALQDSPVNAKNIDLELLKPYLPSRKPFGKLIGELKQEVLESPVLKIIAIKPEHLARLRETLQILAPKLNTFPYESDIKRQVDISGIRYEAKVKQLLIQPENQKIRMELGKDLKGQLLELNQILKQVIRKFSDQNLVRQLTDFQQKIKISVDNIELHQLSTRISNQENQPLVLQIPNPICPNEKTLNLFIRKDSQESKSGEQGDKEVYNLAFYLELSGLGNIKMNVKVGLESMEVRIDVEQEGVAEFIRNNAPEFEKRMKKKDLNTTVECCKEEKVLPIKDNLIELLVSKNTSLLSVKT